MVEVDDDLVKAALGQPRGGLLLLAFFDTRSLFIRSMRFFPRKVDKLFGLQCMSSLIKVHWQSGFKRIGWSKDTRDTVGSDGIPQRLKLLGSEHG